MTTYVIQFDAEDPDGPPVYNVGCGGEGNASQATRYATRELAELVNEHVVGGAVVEAPPTAHGEFLAFLGGGGSPEEIRAKFLELYPAPPVVTEPPSDYRAFYEVLVGELRTYAGLNTGRAENAYREAVTVSRSKGAEGASVTLSFGGNLLSAYDPKTGTTTGTRPIFVGG